MISGPEAIVKGMRDVLAALSIDGDSIKTEEFSGYEVLRQSEPYSALHRASAARVRGPTAP
jgi:ferredoxin-NADP reductase